MTSLFFERWDLYCSYNKRRPQFLKIGVISYCTFFNAEILQIGLLRGTSALLLSMETCIRATQKCRRSNKRNYLQWYYVLSHGKYFTRHRSRNVSAGCTESIHGMLYCNLLKLYRRFLLRCFSATSFSFKNTSSKLIKTPSYKKFFFFMVIQKRYLVINMSAQRLRSDIF